MPLDDKLDSEHQPEVIFPDVEAAKSFILSKVDSSDLFDLCSCAYCKAIMRMWSLLARARPRRVDSSSFSKSS